MKFLTHIITALLFAISFLLIETVSAGVVEIAWSSTVQQASIIKNWATSWNIVTEVNKIGFSLLTLLKVILQWIVVIYIVYIWVMMVISMWTDEDRLSKAKNQLRYTMLAFLFINIPGTLYKVFQPKEDKSTALSQMNNSEFLQNWSWWNMFVNVSQFWLESGTLFDIAAFIEYLILGIAVFMIILAWINIMTSRWREEKVTEAKNKIVYSLFALIFVGLIEWWIKMIRSGNLENSAFVFGKLVNLALFLAGPIALFFLTLAGYYYITSNGEEERVKKAKNIIINTLIWCLLLAVMMTFLFDLNSLF